MAQQHSHFFYTIWEVTWVEQLHNVLYSEDKVEANNVINAIVAEGG